MSYRNYQPIALCIALSLVGAASTARAEIKTQTVEYSQGDAVLEGFLAYDDAVQGKRPAVLVVHTWTGSTISSAGAPRSSPRWAMSRLRPTYMARGSILSRRSIRSGAEEIYKQSPTVACTEPSGP